MSRPLDTLLFAAVGLALSFMAALIVHVANPAVAAFLVLVSIPLYCFTVARVWDALEARS